MKTAEHDSHDHEKCKELFATLSEYIDSELDEEICKKIEAHLKNCECCNTCLLTLRKTIELCGNYESYPVPAGLSEKLRSRS